MVRYALLLLLTYTISVSAQPKLPTEKNLRAEWKQYKDAKYQRLPADEIVPNAVYLTIETSQFSESYFCVNSSRHFFIFFNGQLCGEYSGRNLFSLDSLSIAHNTSSLAIGIYQDDINERDLITSIVGPQRKSMAGFDVAKRPTYFNDFVVLAGLIIMILFLIIVKSNPKLASDYFTVSRIFSIRETEDVQSNARLTSSSNLQFYVICSLLLSFYMTIIFRHLPRQYALPLYFRDTGFLSATWHWIQISVVILTVFMGKILLIFSLTRLFGMRGLARIHFFNWVRLLLIVIGTSSVVLFVYFISRGQSPQLFVVFLSVVIGTLVAWIFIVFLKLNGKTEHSMFHLFSYICATEIIPLLITIKVLFQ
jgi:hypothetical protein